VPRLQECGAFGVASGRRQRGRENLEIFYPTSGLYTSPGAIAEAEFDWDAEDDEPLGDPDDDLEF
jgi:hypothetical protein